MMAKFNGLNMGLGNLSRVSKAKSRSISPENFAGKKGKGGMATEGTGKACALDLGQKWKVSPSVEIKAGETFELANIEGPGAIQHIWMTPTGPFRSCILRIYWEDQAHPSVECPLGDFFAYGWGDSTNFQPLVSQPVCVNPGSGLNCFWEMPFRKKCRMTVTNREQEDTVLYYQIDYTLTEVPEDAAYFHAQFRRVNPLPYKENYVIVDNIKGEGQYVGTYLAWGVNNNGWWGEGEIKFFMDGDSEFPTICGTGTEDYILGSYDFVNQKTRAYQHYTTPYAGLNQIISPDGLYQSQQRFSMYRWHIMDPIRFENDLKVTIQALGWRNGGPYLPLQDDIASVAYWYQTLPSQPFPLLPDFSYLEII